MQPWKVGVGLVIAITALTVMIGAHHFDYLRPYRSIILTQYWWPILLYGGTALTIAALAIAGILRTLGLFDLGSKVGVVERSIRRGEGDPSLARRLSDQRDGDFTD